MPFYQTLVLPNGATATYHRIIKVEVSDSPRQTTVTVCHWASEADYLARRNPLWHSYPALPDPDAILSAAQEAMLSMEEYAAGTALPDVDSTLESAKLRRRLQINAWRMEANLGHFVYQGKQIACDRLSRGDIDGVNGELANTGLFPAGFPHAWKAMDNTYVSIPDAATWYQFYSAMTAQGTSNFMRAQGLKALVDAATTEEAVSLITWETPLT